MIKLSLLLLVFFAFFQLSSQSDSTYLVPVIGVEGQIITPTGDSISKVNIVLKRPFKRSQQILTDSSGTFSFTDLPYKTKYKLIFKKKGFVTKKIVIDAKKNYQSEDVTDIVEIPMNIVMLEKKEGINYKVISRKPVGRYAIDENTGLLDLDRDYTKKRVKEIEVFFKK